MDCTVEINVDMLSPSGDEYGTQTLPDLRSRKFRRANPLRVEIVPADTHAINHGDYRQQLRPAVYHADFARQGGLFVNHPRLLLTKVNRVVLVQIDELAPRGED